MFGITNPITFDERVVPRHFHKQYDAQYDGAMAAKFL
jgi:hypothetical protein